MTTADPGSPILIYMLAGLIFSLGLFLLIFGLFGKRIDDHPWCRKCRFDLFGRDEDAEQTCPECGSDLTQSKAIRIGQRRKRRGVITVGALIMLLAVCSAGVKVYTDVAGINWQHYKPVSWLMNDANQTPGTTSSDALLELRRRYDASLLTPDQVDDIIEAALTHQADHHRAWQTHWGNFVELGRQNGDTSDAQWKRYGEGVLASVLTVQIRSKIVIGTKQVRVRMGQDGARIGDENRFPFLLSVEQKNIKIGPVSLKQRGSYTTGISHNGSGASTTSLSIGPLWNDITPGKHAVNFESELTLYEGQYRNNPITKQPLNTLQTVAFLPADRSTVTLIKDPAYRDQMKNAISISNIRCKEWARADTNVTYRYDVTLRVTERLFEIPETATSVRTSNGTVSEVKLQPIDVAFDVFLRYEGKEYGVGSITQLADSDMTFGLGNQYEIDLANKNVDVMLRPSVEEAEASIDCFEIWGEEIVLEDQPISGRAPNNP